uniref:Small monomeric GTPase n=1 Tax=Arion vulgaris TaxID=1028688 RepID=A0A0B6ZHX7_9EUPU
MDVRYMDILVEGERIPDDENFFHSVPKLDAPNSAPHSRTSSFKNRPRSKLNINIQATQRPRTNSLPNAYLPLPDPFYMPETGRLQRVRSFKTTSKGLVNHGDSFKRSSNSLKSAESAGSISDLGSKSPRRSSNVSDDSGPDESHESAANTEYNFYRVLMMGAPGVGKSALARQFMTSEYKGTYVESNTPDVLEPERNVSVLLDGQESTLHFLDEEQHPDFEAEEIPIDAYVAVFSVSNTASYNQIVKSIRTLREEHKTNKAIILVGNKIDLARQRRIARHDALRIAKKYDCRYIETSAALNHHVDELLVGILSQIREQIAPSASNSLAPPSDSKSRSRSKSPGKAISDFFSKIFGTNNKKAKSCETLFVQ